MHAQPQGTRRACPTERKRKSTPNRRESERKRKERTDPTAGRVATRSASNAKKTEKTRGDVKRDAGAREHGLEGAGTRQLPLRIASTRTRPRRAAAFRSYTSAWSQDRTQGLRTRYAIRCPTRRSTKQGRHEGRPDFGPIFL